MKLELPPRLVQASEASDEGRAWLRRLPGEVAALARRWSLRFDAQPFAAATCSFVAIVQRADGSPAVLKLGLPHLEAEHELDGLRFWNGDPTVRLLDADEAAGALLLERCAPGTPLSARPEPEQDRVIARLLRRLWRVPRAGHPFRPLSAMARYRADLALARSGELPDAGFVRAGVERWLELARPAAGDVLLATDLHAGNVLAAEREPWLVIDPKPFVGDATYDATQHLLNCSTRLCADPAGTVTSFASELEVDAERVRHWLFARLAVHLRANAAVFGLPPARAVQLARELE